MQEKAKGEIRMLTGEPALMIGETLLIADLHLGIEYEFKASGMLIPNLYQKTLDKLKAVIDTARPKEIVFLGDIKHKVPGTSFQEMKQVPDFFREIAGMAKITCLAGNHDPGLKELLPETVAVAEETAVGSAYLTHGHRWPDPRFFDYKYLIIGHIHPQFEFKSSLGYVWREPAWVWAGLSEKILKQYPGANPVTLPRLVIMPAFNGFVGGRALNSEKSGSLLGPIAKMIKKASREYYMLDGTYLGRI